MRTLFFTLFTIFFGVCIPISSYSQDGCTDIMLEYEKVMQIPGDSAQAILDSMEKLLKETKSDCYYEILIYKGARYEYMGKGDKCLEYFMSLKKNKKLMSFPRLRAMIDLRLAPLNCSKTKHYDLAFKQYTNALDIGRSLKNYRLVNQALSGQAAIYAEKRDTLNWNKTSTELMSVLNEHNKDGRYDEALLYAYLEFGYGNVTYGKLDSSVKYYNLYRSLGNENNFPDVDLEYFLYMGWAYINANKAKIGLKYLDSITVFSAWQAGPFKAEYWQYRAIGNFKIKNYNKALWCLDSMIVSFNIPAVFEQYYLWQYKIYKKQGRYQEALLAHENHIKYADSIKGKEALRNVEVTKRQIASLKQEERIKLSEQSQKIFKKQRWLFGGGVALLALFALLFIRQRNKKKVKELQAEMAEVQLASLKSQMNPHFMFNSINSIKGLIINEAAEAAADQLTRFSKLMRSTLNYSSEKKIPLKDEMEFITTYSELERFKGNIPVSLNFDIASTIDPEVTKIIPFLIQPFVENSFKHAFHEIGGRTPEINIRFKEEGAYLQIEIDDNGVGVKDDNASVHISKGTGLVQKRLELHNKEKENVSINFRGRDKGTLVKLKIKK